MSVYDRIAASSPINKQAAQSTSRGNEWTPVVALQDYFADIPPMISDAEFRARSTGPQFVDFRGREFGRLKVIGVMAKASEKTRSWVCRCKCGGFCTRTTKSLKVAAQGGNTFVGMCGRCDYQGRLAKGWSPNIKRQEGKQ